MESTLTSRHSSLTRSASSRTSRKHSLGRYTSSMYVVISPSVVFSILPLTLLANSWSSGCSSSAVMMGVEMFLEALMISLTRGTPCVMFMEATPAKWKVFRVIWVPGSPML